MRQCNLTRLEEQTLDFAREGDVDGAEIPGLYFAYLRDGDEGRLAAVFEHNRLDILALAALAGRMGCLLYTSNPGNKLYYLFFVNDKGEKALVTMEPSETMVNMIAEYAGPKKVIR